MRRRWSAFIGGKQVNGRALLIVVLTMIVGGGVTYLVHGFQVRRNAGDLLEQAGVTEGEGDPIQAIRYLEQYLGLMPGDREGMAKLGLLLSRESLLVSQRAKRETVQRRAYFLLDAVLRGPDDGQVADRRALHREVSRLALRLRRFPDAYDHIQELCNTEAADAELLQLKGQCEVGLGKYAEAEKSYDQAFKIDQRPAIANEYALLLRELKKPAAADDVIKKMVNDDPTPTTRLEAARYFVKFGQPANAAPHLLYILNESATPSAEVLLLAGRIELGRGALAEARKHFERGRQLYPDSAPLQLGLAQIELSNHDVSKALALLEPSLQKLPTDITEARALANLLIDAHVLDKARTVIDHLKTLGEPNDAACVDFLEGRLLVAKGNWGEAVPLLERARADSRYGKLLGTQANLLLAECSDHLLNPDQKLEALRRAVQLEPKNAVAGRALALAQAALGDFDSALARLRQLVAQGVPVKAELARVLMDRARKVPDPRLLQEAGQLLSGGTNLLQAELLVLQGKLPEARQLVEAERDRDPNEVAPWLFLIGLADRQAGNAQAVAVLDQAAGRTGKHVEWPLVRAMLSLKAGLEVARKQLPKLLAAADQFSGADQDRLLMALADGFNVIGEAAQARRLWQRVVHNDRGNLPACFAYFDAVIQAKELDAAAALLQQIKRLEGGAGAFTAYGEGALRLAQVRQTGAAAPAASARIAEAHAFLARAALLRPTWAQVPLLEATAYELEGQKEKALDKYRGALERGEDRLIIVQRVLQLLGEQRHFAEAHALLAKIKDKKAAESPELSRLAAQLTFLSAGAEGQDPKAARRQALDQARTAAAGSKDYRDYFSLGQIASLTGDPQDLREAEKAFSAACALKPTAPENWTALVSLLARIDAKRAERALAQAQRNLSQDQAALVLALGSEALGQAAKAEEHFQALLQLKPYDAVVLQEAAAFYARHNKAVQATATLKTLLEPDIRAPAATKAWARRCQALMLALQGGPERFRQAETLLAEVDKADPDNVETRVVHAKLLAMQPARRSEAIQAIEGLQGAMPDDLRFVLAQLYEADGNWPLAENHLLALLRNDEKNPNYLARYVSGLLRQKNTKTAQLWVEKLAQVAPTALRTRELRLGILKAANKTDEAVQLIQEYARSKDARLDLAAYWFELLGKSADAEKTYRAFVAASKQPESVLVLALFLGRQKRAADALALCERAQAACRPEAIAIASVTVLRTANADAKQWQAVESWIKNAIDKKRGAGADAIPLKFLLAELYEYSKRPQDSILIYRELLKHNPRHLPTLNNLAYVVALANGDTTEPLQLINQAIELAGANDELLDTRAVIYLKNGHAARALQDLGQAFGQTPTSVRYFHLAQAQDMAKNKIGAADAWRQALDLGLNISSIHPLERATYERLSAQFKLGW